MFKIFAGVAAALVAVSASAADVADPPTISVPYHDLDLNNPQGARDMVRRIRHAADKVCRSGPWNVKSEIETIERYHRCYSQAFREAVVTLDRPLVTAAAGLGAAPSRATGVASR